MKDTIDIAFIVNISRLIVTCWSLLIMIICKEILFFLKNVIWLVVNNMSELIIK